MPHSTTSPSPTPSIIRAGSVRRPLLAAILLAGALLLAGCSSAAPAAAPPARGSATTGLVAKETTIDLGRVPFDRQVEARFELTNAGSKPIRFTTPPQVKMLEGC